MTASSTCESSRPPATVVSQQHQTHQQRDKHTVHWFRKGLRLHDNPAFSRGVLGSKTFRCIFIIDPWFVGSSNVGINKWRFLLQCLEDLDRSLNKFNSRLFVIRGQPADALPKLFKKWGTTCLSFEEDPEPFGKVRDRNITELCNGLNIEVIQSVSHTLYKLEHIIERNGGQAPLTYNQFQAIVASMDSPKMAESVMTPEQIQNSNTPIDEDHDEKYGVPTLYELGFETDNLMPPIWVGGETEALARLERHLERKAWVASFGKPKMTPQSLLASQTGLSPYLRFGCLSTRLFYHQLTDLYKKIKKTCPPLSLHGQLLWREFFYCAATKNSNFDRMEQNPICVQIPWQRDPNALAKWANGHTGFPWIDAIMTQLREEGWIHHLARHAVACFLTRGDLWISWEEGMKVFEELLLDADWSVNAGTWMWLSCSSFFQQFFHCYCPVKFGRKADPNGDYIRKYIPALKNFPTKYIHEPWNAPGDVQASAKCIIGRDYPLPIVNHINASRTNMRRLKQVYQQLSKYRHSSDTLIKTKQFTINSNTPSPNTIISNVNNSGPLLCKMSNNQLDKDFNHPSQMQTIYQQSLHHHPLEQQLHPQSTSTVIDCDNIIKYNPYNQNGMYEHQNIPPNHQIIDQSESFLNNSLSVYQGSFGGHSVEIKNDRMTQHTIFQRPLHNNSYYTNNSGQDPFGRTFENKTNQYNSFSQFDQDHKYENVIEPYHSQQSQQQQQQQQQQQPQSQYIVPSHNNNNNNNNNNMQVQTQNNDHHNEYEEQEHQLMQHNLSELHQHSQQKQHQPQQIHLIQDDLKQQQHHLELLDCEQENQSSCTDQNIIENNTP